MIRIEWLAGVCACGIFNLGCGGWSCCIRVTYPELLICVLEVHYVGNNEVVCHPVRLLAAEWLPWARCRRQNGCFRACRMIL